MSRAVVIGTLLANVLVHSAWAQTKTSPDVSVAPYPSASVITFQWDYSCANGSLCSFSCAGGGANHVTKLSIYLGAIPIDAEHKNPSVLYEFSTRESPRNNGFSLSTGITTLACQVNGMTLDYAGTPRARPSQNDTTATVGVTSDNKH